MTQSMQGMGKRHEDVLLTFLDKHAHKMPRAMLRCVIEKLDVGLKKSYLSQQAC